MAWCRSIAKRAQSALFERRGDRGAMPEHPVLWQTKAEPISSWRRPSNLLSLASWSAEGGERGAGPVIFPRVMLHVQLGCSKCRSACMMLVAVADQRKLALASSLKSFQPPEQYLGRSLHCSNQKRSSEFLNLIPFNMSFCFWVGHRLWLSKSSARPEASWNGPCTSMTSKDWKASGFLDKH